MLFYFSMMKQTALSVTSDKAKRHPGSFRSHLCFGQSIFKRAVCFISVRCLLESLYRTRVCLLSHECVFVVEGPSCSSVQFHVGPACRVFTGIIWLAMIVFADIYAPWRMYNDFGELLAFPYVIKRNFQLDWQWIFCMLSCLYVYESRHIPTWYTLRQLIFFFLKWIWVNSSRNICLMDSDTVSRGYMTAVFWFSVK